MKTILENDRDFFCDIDALCFQTLQPEEAAMVRSGKTQVLFRKGDNLTKQGAFTSYVLFIVKGLAIQYVEGDATRNFNLRIISPGEFVGLSAVFHENIFRYSSVALTECQAYLIEKETIGNLVKKNGNFGFSIIKRYCEQNDKLLVTIRNLTNKQMNGRLADTLIYLDSLKKERLDIFQLLSRKDLADFTGITTESTVKLLKTFEKEGLIGLNDKDIILLKYDMLTEISRRG